LGLIIYYACVIGFYYCMEYFLNNSEFKEFTFLIFTTLLTCNNVVRVEMVAAIELYKEDATYRKIYQKDILE